MKTGISTYIVIFFLILLLFIPLSASDGYKKYQPPDTQEKFMSISAVSGNFKFTLYHTGGPSIIQFDNKVVEKLQNEIKVNGDKFIGNGGFYYPDSFYNTDIIYSVDIDTNQSNQTEIIFYRKTGAKSKFYQARNKNIISITRDITIEPGQFVRGSAVSFWADINIPDGEISGNVIAVAGDINIGSKAVIRGDVIALDGKITLDKNATVYGMIQAPNLKKGKARHEWYRWYRTGKYFSLITRFYYNRVDGASPHFGIGFIDEDSLLPDIKVYGGYAFASERWRYHFEMAKSFNIGSPVSIGTQIYRKLATYDDGIVSETENSIFALLATEDYRDYYEAEGVCTFARFFPSNYVTFEGGFIAEKHHWLYARRDLWSLFGGSKLFPENFASFESNQIISEIARINDIRMKTLLARINVKLPGQSILMSHSHLRGRLTLEWTPSEWNDHYDFTRYMIEIVRHQYISKYLAVRIRGVFGSSGGDIPIHRLFYLGGIGTMLGYDHKEYFGSSIWSAILETKFNIPRSEFAIRAFLNTGQTAARDDDLSDAEFKSSLGFGLSMYDHIHMYIARRMDRSQNIWLFHVRLGRNF
jgi:hypothetical protein